MYSLTAQSGCSFLFLCLKYHTDIVFYLRNVLQLTMHETHYIFLSLQFHCIQAMQIVNHIDTNHTLHFYLHKILRISDPFYQRDSFHMHAMTKLIHNSHLLDFKALFPKILYIPGQCGRVAAYVYKSFR